MRSRAFLLALCLVPLALAHGPPPAYDPLVVQLHAFLHSDLRVSEARPAEGAVAFPAASPAAPGAPMQFTFTAPVRFAPAGGFSLQLALRAEAPVATGDGLEIAIVPGGAPQRVALAPLLGPGDLASVGVVLTGAAEYAKGDPTVLSIRALAPALSENAFFLMMGPEASRLDALDMRVPTIADLELQDAPRVEFLAEGEDFAPARPATLHRFDVSHSSVQGPTTTGSERNSTYVVLVGAEEDADALAHSFPDRERRVAAAHAFTVDGVLARVVPGLGVALPVAQLPARIVCVAHCPAGGFSSTIPGAGGEPGEDRPSALEPPARETRGIPISKDAPEEKGTPIGGLAGAALALAAARRRRSAR